MERARLEKLKMYMVPGIVFQSLVVAGGYGTGRELAEFFLRYGTWGGLFGMLGVSLAVWSVVCALTFALARKFSAYDYRAFFTKLLGPAWPAYEVCYFAMVVLILAVVVSAAGETLRALCGLDYMLGVGLMALVTGFLVLRGAGAIEKFLSWWSFVLYGVYLVFLAVCLARYGGALGQAFAGGGAEPGWALGGLRYALYNLGSVPAVLFTVRRCKTPRQAAVSGVLAGVIGILPALFLFLGMAAFTPFVLSEPLPVNAILQVLGLPWLQTAFQIVLFGTLIETAAGLIFAVADRFESSYAEYRLSPPRALRPALTAGLLAAGAALARIGLTGLVQSGYGTVSWAFLPVYALPLVTVGVFLLLRRAKG